MFTLSPAAPTEELQITPLQPQPPGSSEILTVGVVGLAVDTLVSHTIRVISPAHSTGVLNSIRSKDIVTANSLEDP